MAKPIKITVRARDTGGQDAPTVKDLFCQIQDCVSVLQRVEEAAMGNDAALVWRVTDVTKNSPFTFEITPSAQTFGMNIDHRAAKIVAATAEGLGQIRTRDECPPYFNDAVINDAEKINSRLTNGLAETSLDFSAYNNAPPLVITPQVAERTIQNISKIKPAKHRELGAIEGFIIRVALDKSDRPLVWIRSRLDQKIIKCIAVEGGLQQIGDYRVAEVLKGMRVRVNGLILYKNPEQVESIEVENIQVFKPDSELPDSHSIVSPNFTSGVEASAYLKALREDGEANRHKLY